MNTQLWQQIEEIFQSALDLAPAARGDFIAEQCGENSDLKREVEKLLADYDSAESFIESPVWTKNSLLGSSAMGDFGNSLDEQLKDQPIDPMLGRQIGSYRLTGEIGRGGMGAVYAAERADGSFRQRVAIKLIKRGMDTDFILRRFRQERQILAQLSHPFIAQLLDGGTTTDNLPYFVMEFIEGEPLYKYCDRKKLNINGRLKLFRQICQALDFAHQNQIIHRDIKPPNILVSGRGTPKLLDFGIAKVLNPEFGIDTIDPTLTAMRLMTPEYASPEQVCGSPVTPASDIYALGVLLYELLTGHRPYRFKNRAAHEIARVICEEEPDRPSTGITRRDNLLPTGASEATTLIDLCRFRGAEKIEDLQRELAGDIERIILKCLRKEQTERYQTAAELEQDITRYLEGKPVVAESFSAAVPVPVKSPSQTDKLTKSLAVLPLKILSRAPSTDTGEEFLSVGLADALVTRLSGVQRLVVRPTSSVLRFGNGGDAFAAGRELGVDFVVDGNIRRVGARIRVTAQLLNVKTNSTVWSESFDEQLADFLALEDSISERVAESLIPRLTGDEEKRLRKRGTDSPEAYEAYMRGRFHWNLQSEESFAKAITFFERAVELDPNYALAHAAIAEYYIFLGIHCIVPFKNGAKIAKELVEKATRLDPSLAAARAMQGFIEVCYNWDWAAAEKHLRRALKLNPNSVTAHNWLSTVLLQTGRFEEAVKETDRVIELDPDSIISLHLKAWTLYHSRRYAESIKLHRKLIETEPNYAWGLQTYSWVLRRLGQYEEAIAPAERSVELTGENPFYLTSLAAAYAEAGMRERAGEILLRLAEISKTRFVSEYMLSLAHCALGDADRAFENLEKSFAARDGWLNWLSIDPQFDVLRDDARYQDLLRRAGNPLAKPEAARPAEPTTAAEKSIAVLPLKLFGAQTGTGEDEYLAVGLADALVTRLSNVRRLTVRPTSSVLPFNNTDANPFEAGRELGVDYVLDGNIRRAGDRIRVTVQLLNISDNSSRWAEKFSEHFTDVLELEDSISERVAKSLLPRLTGEEEQQLSRRGTNSPEAYEAYLRGRYFWNLFTPDTFPKALEWFEKAVELDADYALAHVGIADFYNWATIFGLYPPPEGYQKTKAAAIRALEIDNRLSEAHAVLGFLTTFADFDWTRGEYLLKHALELNPHNALAHEWYSALLAGTGRGREAEREILRAHELDPLSLREKTLTAWHLYQLRLFPEALAQAEEIIEMNPLFYQGFFQRGNVLNEMGRSAEAVADLRKALEIAPEAGYLYYKLCFALVAIGEPDEAWRILRDFEKLPASAAASAYHLAMCYASLDERDQAFEWFDRAVESRDMWLVWLATEPKLDKLRDDERFNELLRKTNRPHLVRQIRKTPKATETAAKVFAVLPFKFNSLATGGDTDDKFLGVGLTDALISRLSKTNSLIVRPTSSVLQFDETSDAFAAGRKLAADFVLDGNVRRVGERIRVSVQLLNINQTATAWAETFDEKFTDILEVEDSISGRVAESLLPHLTGEEHRRISKRGTDSPAAYEAYLRGRFHWNQFTPESLPKALDSFQKAVELDPEYALAYVGLADFYIWANIYGIVPSPEAGALAEAAARRAVELNSQQSEAYATLGLIKQNQCRWDESARFYKKSLELQPNYVHAHEWYGATLIGLGDVEAGVKEIKRAEQLDPLSLRTKTLIAFSLYQAGRYDETLERGRQIIELDKNYPQGYSQTGLGLLLTGQTEEALANFLEFDRMVPNSALAKFQLCFGFVAVNRPDEAGRVFAEIKALAAEGYVKPYFLAMAHTALGEFDAAFRYFEQSVVENEPWMLWFGTEPLFDALRGDARYFELLRRMNNPIGERQKKSRNLDTGGEKSIAVLPLKILGANTLDDDDYLGVGLADALITRLSNVRRFVVRPTSSVLQFGAENADSFQAGRKLGVDYVVDGNIQRVGDRIRVTVQLLSIGENSSRWAKKFDEHFTDVLELEDSISERVAKSLLPQLTGEEEKQLSKRGTNSPEAYEAYLRGRFNWNLHTEAGFAKAIGFYNRAVESDPDYALAYTAIAEYYIFLGIHCVIPFADGSKAAFDAAETAIRLDPTLAESHAVRGFVAISYDFDWRLAEEYMLRAVRLNPNSLTAHSWYNSVLLHWGRFDEAMREIDRILELDPDSLLGLHFRAWAFYHSRRFDESIRVHQQMLSNEPNYAWGLQTYSWALRRVGRFDEAVAQARKAVELTGENPFYLMALAAAHADAGNRSEAEKILARLDEISETRFVSEYMLAQVYCALNDKEKAFENLEKAFAARDGWIVWIGVEPQFDSLRDDARFDDLLRRINHPLAPRQTAIEADEANAENRKKSKEKSIAVLPLKLLGSTGSEDTGDDNFLSVGLADALITRLSNVRRFVVRPTSSVLPYGKKAVDSFAAGRELGVDFIVDGSIRRVGKRIRVTAQLLSVRENATRWAQTYDENFVDVLALEDSISEQIAKSLLPHLTGEEKKQIKKRGTDNPEAFEAYLRGRHYWNTFTEEGFAKSLIYYNQAISIAPDYALAYAGIADYHNWLGIYTVLPFAETSAAAKAAARKAIEIDPNLAEAYAALGFATAMHDFDWTTAERHFMRAVELNPNYAIGRVWYGYYLAFCGRFDEALAHVKRAIEIDRFTPIVPQTLNWILYHARRFDEAIAATRNFIKDEPRYGLSLLFFGSMLWRVGQFEEAIKVCRRSVELLGRSPYTLVWLASAHAAAGEPDEARQLIAEIEELSARRYVSPYLSAMIYCNLNDREKALALLEKAWEIRDARLLWLGVDPQFDQLRGEPRFEAVLRRTNNPQITSS